ncbi:MAG: DUF1343 domain-containing protein [Gemmatimonadota bacterium]|nr:DUF1343 domain-containing protein [Gemmatimonadota bacterium]
MRLAACLLCLSLGAQAAQSQAPPGVVPGIEVLLSDSIHLVRGKRVGLITNHSGRGRDGTSSIDLLFRSPGVRLTALFGPEHGLRGEAQAGERVESTVDSATGVPIYSLYGATRVPTPEMLRDVDVLLYDIQDVGARVYTYEWTMALTAAAVKARVPFIVLDRPDPIRADRVEGNILEPPFASFVGQFPVALRYGLTPGELIRFLTGTKLVDAGDVQVVPMRGYTRSMWYDETGLAWRNPSPNIKSLDAALLYPGTVFFEGTNLSEGRGTDAPFQLIGAPWLTDAADVAAELNALELRGVRFEAVTREIEKGQKHGGAGPVPMIHVVVTDRNRIRPVRVGVTMLAVIRQRHLKEFEWRPSLERLAGTADLRAAVEQGTTDALMVKWDAEAERFAAASKPYWLYAAGGRAGGAAAGTAYAAASGRLAPTRYAAARHAVAPGVTWTHVEDPAGPWTADVAAINLRACGCELRHVRAMDSLVAREKVSAMAARQPARVLAAINGDFFNVRTGENENNQVIAGEWWKGMRGSDSPYDAFANVRTHFAVDARGRPMMDRFVLDGTAIHGADVIPVLAVNFLPRSGGETSVLFTDRMGATPRDSARALAESPLRFVARRGDTAVYVQDGAVRRRGGNAIPAGTAVLSAYGPRANTVAKFAPGDTVRIVLRAASRAGEGPDVSPRLLIGGWPRILRDGRNVAARAAWSEGTLSSNAEVRHPRSAVGFSRDSATLYLVSVDGRQAASAGMTLVELADFVKKLGAWDAMNFDGGGSTTLVVDGKVVNSPSDPAGERPVGDALVVVVGGGRVPR